MATTQEHYDNHLGPVYTWMLGDFVTACQAAEDELKTCRVAPKDGDLLVDLGCGSGHFSIAMARTGASVVALDSSKTLLAELSERSGDFAITPVHSDILTFREYVDRPASAIVCMGDTLTHLVRFEDVQQLLHSVADVLQDGGMFVTTFRDYCSSELTAESRFISVKSDSNRILTCFLDYGSRSVKVTDLIHERDEEGVWQLRTSTYEKLRLEPSAVATILRECGCSVRTEDGFHGMVRVVAVKRDLEIDRGVGFDHQN